jgi:hypothetical protein
MQANLFAQSNRGHSISFTNSAGRAVQTFVTDPNGNIVVRQSTTPANATASFKNLPTDSVLRLIDSGTRYDEFKIGRLSLRLDYNGQGFSGHEGANFSDGGAPTVSIAAVPSVSPARKPEVSFENLSNAVVAIKLFRSSRVGVWTPDSFEVPAMSTVVKQLGGNIGRNNPIKYQAVASFQSRNYTINLKQGANNKVQFHRQGVVYYDNGFINANLQANTNPQVGPKPIAAPQSNPAPPAIGFTFQPTSNGLFVNSVDADSLAEGIGMQPGQTVIAVNYQRIFTEQQYRDKIKASMQGDGMVQFVVQQPNSTTTVELKAWLKNQPAESGVPIVTDPITPTPIRGRAKN